MPRRHAKTADPILGLLGQNIRNRRTHLGLRQIDIAAAAELDERYYQDIERGKVNVTLTTASRIAGALQVNVSDLYTVDQIRISGSLEEFVERNRSAFLVLEVPVVVQTLRGRVVLANDSLTELIGYTEEEMMEQDVYHHLSKQSQEQCEVRDRSDHRGGGVLSTVTLTKSGNKVDANAYRVMVNTLSGVALGLIVGVVPFDDSKNLPQKFFRFLIQFI